MSKARKTAWMNMAAALLMLFSAARDVWTPGLLSISGRPSSGADVTLRAVAAVLFLGVACRGFMRMRPAATR